jgi:LuxR family transcriptional regulator, maltose regulon positive regulatory protein
LIYNKFMATDILATKLYLPPPRPGIVPRPRLVERLNESLAAGRKLALISASAGFGKTTLASEWVAVCERPVAWLSLDEGDNDPTRFLTYFIAALQTITVNIGAGVLSVLQSPQPPSTESILTTLLNEITTIPDSFILVLDDYHVIDSQPVDQALTFLVEHLPKKLHLVISTRVDPPWPLARFRARNQLIEIRSQDLRFTTEEAASFLNQVMGLNLATGDVAALEERTEGWVAGLQFAALSMKGRIDIAGFIKVFTGSHVYVAEYLLEEVLKQLPQDMQSFLLQTSVLERLNAGLCEAVTGCQDGQAMLMSLLRANIFVFPLDDEGWWFRYHQLFSELLKARLQKSMPAEAISVLHQRAAAWFEQNGFEVEAINHALTAKDFERVASMVEKAAHTIIYTGQVNILRDWLETLPEASFHTHPRLTFYHFWIDLLQGKADLSEQAIQEREALLKALPSSPENDQLRGELMAVVCRAMVLSGHTSRGIRLAQEALENLSKGDLASRARANSALAMAYGLEGRAEEAKLAYGECLPQAIAAGDYRLAAHTTMVMALNQCHYGQLYEAARSYQSIINLEDQAGVRKVFFPAGQGYIGLASIHLERNDLETAENYLKQGMELCRQGGLDAIFLGRILMSRLRQAKGDLEGALKEIQLPKQAFQRADDFTIAVRQIQIRLAEGDIDGASGWAAPFMEMLSNATAAVRPPLLLFESIEAIVVRVFLARGETEKALELLDKLQATAEPGGRFGYLIEIFLLRALVYQKMNQGSIAPKALECFEHALELAEPEDYILLFLEAGQAVIPLLNAVVNHLVVPDRLRGYARKLLSAFRGYGKPSTHQSPVNTSGLIESLTPREMEVLQLIAAGASNRTIADKLVITVRTVKKHTNNIFGKLNASSRTQVVACARQLGLLPKDS